MIGEAIDTLSAHGPTLAWPRTRRGRVSGPIEIDASRAKKGCFTWSPYRLSATFPWTMWVNNLAEEPMMVEVAATFAIALAVTAALDLATRVLTVDAAAHGLAVSLAVLAIFLYGHAQHLTGPRLPHRLLLAPWLAAWGLATWLTIRHVSSRPVQSLARLAARGSVALVAIIAIAGSSKIFSQFRASVGGDFAGDSALADESAGGRRDLYFLILDGYARADVLENVLDFDNRQFLSRLRERGFFVADQARANYSQTRLALPAALSMEYLPAAPPDDPYEPHHAVLRALRKNNRVARTLRGHGYSYRYVGSSFYRGDEAADENFAWGGNDGGYVVSFLATTLFDLGRHALDRLGWFSHPADVLEYQLAHVAAPKRTTGAMFTFAHLCCPHLPYAFDRHGRRERVIDREEDATPRDYAEQVMYLNQQVLALIDRIDATSGGDATIILQADHGTAFLGMSPRPTAAQLHERMSIFSAVRGPRALRERLYPSITPINTLRATVATLVGENLPPLLDRSLYSTYERPFDFHELSVESPTQHVETSRDLSHAM